MLGRKPLMGSLIDKAHRSAKLAFDARDNAVESADQGRERAGPTRRGAAGTARSPNATA
jgi:hypothetical protein